MSQNKRGKVEGKMGTKVWGSLTKCSTLRLNSFRPTQPDKVVQSSYSRILDIFCFCCTNCAVEERKHLKIRLKKWRERVRLQFLILQDRKEILNCEETEEGGRKRERMRYPAKEPGVKTLWLWEQSAQRARQKPTPIQQVVQLLIKHTAAF